MAQDPIALFSLTGTIDLARRVAARLETPLSPVEERAFEDGEHKIRPLVSVEGQDAFVLHALHGDARQSVNDKLCRLLFFLATLRDHGATRVTAVLPQGSAHAAARSRDRALCRRLVRGGRHRPGSCRRGP